MHLHVECQCLSTNSCACLLYFLDEAVIDSALPRMMATETDERCKTSGGVHWWPSKCGGLYQLKGSILLIR